MTEADELRQHHRARQLLLRRFTAANVARLWPGLDPSDLDGSFPRFAATVTGIVERNRLTSAGLSARFVRELRELADVEGTFVVPRAPTLDLERLVTSLRVTSVVSVKSAVAEGSSVDVAMADALTRVSGTAVRHVLDAGRETVLRAVATDQAAKGWRRVLGTDGCAFCRMLAGRGAVYNATSVTFASHDRCGCSAEPDYGGSRRAVSATYQRSQRKIGAADRRRVREWIAANPDAG